MALMKLCRCGRKIEYHIKHCDKCSVEIKKEKIEKIKRYDKEVRYSDNNRQYTTFYNSKAWRTLSDLVKVKYHGLCVVCEVERADDEELTVSDTTHHIIELREDWSLRLVEDNLIPLCHDCHNKLHIDYSEKIKIYLKNIIVRFKKKY